MSGYEEQELIAIDAALDANPDATSNEVFQVTRPYDERAIASVAASRALAGGGGSLPDPISTPVTITTTDNTHPALTVDESGKGVGPLRFIANDPDDNIIYNSAGQWFQQTIAGTTSGAQWVDATGGRQFYIFEDASGGIIYGQAEDGSEAIFIRADAFTELRPVVIQIEAPADAALSAGQCSIWFDQTNGASKLKIKGKSANGTVVVGEVALT